MASCDPMTTRTPEERERMHQVLYDADSNTPPWWRDLTPTMREFVGRRLDRLLTAFPQLWDSLPPPDPAETARKEAEEDGATVERSRIAREMWIRGGHQRDEYPLDVGDLLDVIDRMTARAAAGYPVLIAPKGEK